MPVSMLLAKGRRVGWDRLGGDECLYVDVAIEKAAADFSN